MKKTTITVQMFCRFWQKSMDMYSTDTTDKVVTMLRKEPPTDREAYDKAMSLIEAKVPEAEFREKMGMPPLPPTK